jgi:hypothetical protein
MAKRDGRRNAKRVIVFAEEIEAPRPKPFFSIGKVVLRVTPPVAKSANIGFCGPLRTSGLGIDISPGSV